MAFSNNGTIFFFKYNIDDECFSEVTSLISSHGIT